MLNRALVISALLHGIFLGALFWQGGLFRRTPDPIVARSIPLRALKISDQTRLKKKQIKKSKAADAKKNKDLKKAPEKRKPKPAQKLKKEEVVPETPKPSQKKPEKPKPEKAITLPDEKQKKPKNPKEQPKQTVQKSKPEKSDKRLEKKKKPLSAPEPEDDFLAVMKSVEALKSDPQADDSNDSSEPDPNPDANIDEILSLSELDALRQQLSSCWRLPAGVQGSQDLVIHLKVTMNADRSVQNITVQNTPAEQQHPSYEVAAESAKRALFHPRCTPLKLPKEKFKQWQSFTILFNPKEMII